MAESFTIIVIVILCIGFVCSMCYVFMYRKSNEPVQIEKQQDDITYETTVHVG